LPSGSWTALLDAVRLSHETEVVVTRLIAAGYCRESDLQILVVFDVGYDMTRLAWLWRWR